MKPGRAGLVLLLILLVSALVAGCGGASSTATPAPTSVPTTSPVPTSVADPTATPQPAPTGTPTPVLPTLTPVSSPTSTANSAETLQSTPPPALRNTIEQVFLTVSKLRELQAKKHVDTVFMTREQLARYLLKEFEKENARADMEKDQAFLRMLGLLSAKDDLYQLQVDLLNEQIAGFYDFETREMTLIGTEKSFGPLEEVTLAHEYTHALQDQNFSVKEKTEAVEKDSEKSMGLTALVEGDATLSMLRYATETMPPEKLQELSSSSEVDSQKLDAAPLVLRESLLFPYEQGLNFVVELYKRGGWQAIDDAFANPPVSTSQIMHPEKYFNNVKTLPIQMPEAVARTGDWSEVDRDSLGELGWYLYFWTHGTKERAATAAAGWGGDQYVLLQDKSGRYAAAIRIRLESAGKARDFATSQKGALQAMKANELPAGAGGSVWSTSDNGVWWMAQHGDTVDLVIAPDRASVEQVAGALRGT